MTFEENNNQKKLIGEFFINFDYAVSVIPFIIPDILFPNNISKIQQVNVETLLEGLTTNPLIAKFDALLYVNYKNNEKLLKYNSQLSTKIKSISEIRNSFAHGSYRLGWCDFNGKLDKKYFNLKHSKLTKKNGFEKRSNIYNIDEIKKLNTQLLIIYNCYIKISAIINNINENLDYHLLIEQLSNDLLSIGNISFTPKETLN